MMQSKYFDRWERPDDTTPLPNVWDRFSCSCGSSWRRVDGEFYHRRRDGAVCDGPVNIKYINSVRVPQPQIITHQYICECHEKKLGQGLVRGFLSKFFT